MSRINVENIRHPDAASDSLQLSNTGNITAPGNLSVTGTSTLTDDLNVDSGTLFVDVSTDRVGIGTSTPSSHLHIRANTPALAFQPTADTQENQILFRNAADDATPGRIAYDHNTDQMLFSTNSSQRLRILNDGALQLVNSTGIDFSQIQTNAGGMTSELLDSYEEGTWTPTVGGTSTYSGQQGTYTKIGRYVYVTVSITINSIGTGSTTTITSLPFAAGTGLEGTGHVGFWTSLSRSVTSLMACTNSNQIVFTDTTAATTGVNLNAGIFQNSAGVRFSLMYRV